MSPITQGVVSSLIATFAFLLLARLFQKVVLPWYRDLVYDGVIIAGTWACDMSIGKSRQKLRIELRQTAFEAAGEMAVFKTLEDGREESVLFHVEGTLRDRLFRATFRNPSPRRISAGVLLLEVFGDGRRMAGQTAWYDSNAARILSQEVMWSRAEGAD
jgi:hypothetical protein